MILIVSYLISKNDQEFLEDSNKIDEELEAVHDEVLVAKTTLLDNELSIVDHEPAHHSETNVQVSLQTIRRYSLAQTARNYHIMNAIKSYMYDYAFPSQSEVKLTKWVKFVIANLNNNIITCLAPVSQIPMTV